MTEQEKRAHRCCFTGHRPEKLSMPEAMVVAALQKEIRQAIADGFNVFLSGMARGVDLWAAEAVLRFRNANRSVKLICASPYPGFEERWSRAWQGRYRQVMVRADLVRFISPGYHPACFQQRNEWMVDHAARVIAVWNGQPSGTKNTIDYAARQGIPIITIPQAAPPEPIRKTIAAQAGASAPPQRPKDGPPC